MEQAIDWRWQTRRPKALIGVLPSLAELEKGKCALCTLMKFKKATAGAAQLKLLAIPAAGTKCLYLYTVITPIMHGTAGRTSPLTSQYRLSGDNYILLSFKVAFFIKYLSTLKCRRFRIKLGSVILYPFWQILLPHHLFNDLQYCNSLNG